MPTFTTAPSALPPTGDALTPDAQMPTLTPYRAAAAVWQRYQTRALSAQEAHEALTLLLQQTRPGTEEAKAIRQWQQTAERAAISRATRLQRYERSQLKAAQGLAAQDGQRLEGDAALAYVQQPFAGPRTVPPEFTQAVERWEANAIVQALWGLEQGERRWKSLAEKVNHLLAIRLGQQAAGAGSQTNVDLGASLDIWIPACPSIHVPESRRRLLRADLDKLLSHWGFARLREVNVLIRQLGFEPGETPLLTELAAGYVRPSAQPHLAWAWQGYLERSQVSHVFALNAERRSLNRAAGVSKALAEVALLIHGLTRSIGLPASDESDAEALPEASQERRATMG